MILSCYNGSPRTFNRFFDGAGELLQWWTVLLTLRLSNNELNLLGCAWKQEIVFKKDKGTLHLISKKYNLEATIKIC